MVPARKQRADGRGARSEDTARGGHCAVRRESLPEKHGERMKSHLKRVRAVKERPDIRQLARDGTTGQNNSLSAAPVGEADLRANGAASSPNWARKGEYAQC